jgi:hypothetical protein
LMDSATDQTQKQTPTLWHTGPKTEREAIVNWTQRFILKIYPVRELWPLWQAWSRPIDYRCEDRNKVGERVKRRHWCH